jgi:hypothetical protein
MIFRAIHPTTGVAETRQHVPYRVRQHGAVWEARHAETGRLIARNWIGESELRAACDSMTEPA